MCIGYVDSYSSHMYGYGYPYKGTKENIKRYYSSKGRADSCYRFICKSETCRGSVYSYAAICREGNVVESTVYVEETNVLVLVHHSVHSAPPIQSEMAPPVGRGGLRDHCMVFWLGVGVF